MNDGVTKVAVRYGDLDLNSRHGSVVMLNRLHAAALNACGANEFSFADVRRAVGRSACFEQSMTRAVADLDAPLVTQLYNDRTVAES
ncbi:MAG TPA: UrcA family protein [Caulobacteraceae bacterium]|jgi:UrcA family protein